MTNLSKEFGYSFIGKQESGACLLSDTVRRLVRRTGKGEDNDIKSNFTNDN